MDPYLRLMNPVRETAYAATRNYGRWPVNIPEGFEPAPYDPSDPATWAKAAAQQQAWRFDQGHPDPEWPWEMARKFPSDQHDGGDDDLCEIDLALAGRWPK